MKAVASFRGSFAHLLAQGRGQDLGHEARQLSHARLAVLGGADNAADDGSFLCIHFDMPLAAGGSCRALPGAGVGFWQTGGETRSICGQHPLHSSRSFVICNGSDGIISVWQHRNNGKNWLRCVRKAAAAKQLPLYLNAGVGGFGCKLGWLLWCHDIVSQAFQMMLVLASTNQVAGRSLF